MSLEYLCPPAFIFFIYSFTQIMIDLFQGMYNTSLLKFIISIVITIGLNYLCIKGFRIISWIIVFIPFIFLAVVTSILLFGLGLDPSRGKIAVHSPQKYRNTKVDVRDKYKSMYNSDHKNQNFPTNNHGGKYGNFNNGDIGIVSHSNDEQTITSDEQYKYNTDKQETVLTKSYTNSNQINDDTKYKSQHDIKPETNIIQNNSFNKNENNDNQNCINGQYPLCQINTQIIPSA